MNRTETPEALHKKMVISDSEDGPTGIHDYHFPKSKVPSFTVMDKNYNIMKL